MTVIVLADRGLYAPWLFRRIRRLGWHPFLRVKAGGTFRPEGKARFFPKPGSSFCGYGTAFATPESRLQCTLLARWELDQEEPWFILTDLPPEAGDACWYGMRAWIEQGFKIIKRGGWQWHRTRMTDPSRAKRLWLAMAVATLWLLSVGGEADERIPESTFLDLTQVLAQKKGKRLATRPRLVSVFRRGWVCILVALLNHDPLPLGRFLPEPWPIVLETIDAIPVEWQRVSQNASP